MQLHGWPISYLHGGKKVRAGEVVLSGALTGAETIQVDDTFTVRFDGLGEFDVTFTK